MYDRGPQRRLLSPPTTAPRLRYHEVTHVSGDDEAKDGAKREAKKLEGNPRLGVAYTRMFDMRRCGPLSTHDFIHSFLGEACDVK